MASVDDDGGVTDVAGVAEWVVLVSQEKVFLREREVDRYGVRGAGGAMMGRQELVG